MLKTDPRYHHFVQILREELVPAMGCTEPIALAYGAAKAREVLGCMPDKVLIEASGNIIKNVKSVVVPNTGGLKGIEAAAVAGIVGGKADKSMVMKVVAWVVAAAAKFAALYFIVVKLVCGVMAPSLMAAGTLKEPMLKALPATFSWPQLFTALIGGAVALAIVPVLKKALKR